VYFLPTFAVKCGCTYCMHGYLHVIAFPHTPKATRLGSLASVDPRRSNVRGISHTATATIFEGAASNIPVAYSHHASHSLFLASRPPCQKWHSASRSPPPSALQTLPQPWTTTTTTTKSAIRISLPRFLHGYTFSPRTMRLYHHHQFDQIRDITSHHHNTTNPGANGTTFERPSHRCSVRP